MPDRGGCRIDAEIITAFPVVFRPDGPGGKTSTAIRTDIIQYVFYAGFAESAFERANHGVG